MGSIVTDGASRWSDVSHHSHRTVQRTRMLHGDQRVALEHEAWHAHQHREHVMIERLGWVAEKAPPDVGGGAEAERARHVEFGRLDRLHQAAALEAQHAALVIATQ